MSLKIGELWAALTADDSDFNKTLDSAESKFKGTGKSMEKIGLGLTAAVTAPIVGIGTAAFKAGADFEESMSKIEAVAGASGDELAKLRDLALEMGKKTKYSAGEAAAGMEELLKAGLTTEQVLGGGLSGALSLAAAGDIELAAAAEIAATALNAFRDDALSVKDAADILAGAANASATDVMGLKMGLSQASAVASGMGMTFQDTATALAVFAQNGLKGSDAGTSLKTMLMNLQPVTDKQYSLFKKLGLLTEDGTSKFYDASGSMKSLKDIAGLLNASLTGMTDAQRALALETMFGSDAIRAGNVLFKEGADGVGAMSAAMAGIDADDVAATKMNNFKGSLEQLKGSLETLGIAMSTYVLPAARELADKATEITNNFINLDAGTQQLIMGVLAAVAAIGPLLLVGSQLSKGIGSIIGGAQGLIGVLTKIPAPILIVVAVIGVLVGAFLYLWNTNEDFKNAVIAIWEQIKVAFSAALEFIQNLVTTVWGALVAFWEENGTYITEFFRALWELVTTIFQVAWEAISSLVTTVWTNLVEIGKSLWENFGWAFEIIWESVKNTFKNVWELIKGIFRSSLEVMTGIFDVFSGILTGNWSKVWDGLKNIFKGAWDGMISIGKFALNQIINLINSGISAINSISFDLPAVLGGAHVGFNIPKIPQLADGGIVDKPTLAMIGEGAEQEVVAPLSKLPGIASKYGGGGVSVGQVIVQTSSSDGVGIARDIRQALSFELRKVATI